MAVITDSLNAKTVLDLIGEERTVIVRRDKEWKPGELVEFYSELGKVIQQNDKVTGTIGNGELVKVRQNGLFAGKEDGELEWHSAGMNRSIHDDIVAMYMYELAEDGGDTYFTDHQTAWNDLDDDTKDLCRDLKSKTPTYNDRMKLDRMGIYKNVFSDEQTMMEFRDINGNTSFESQVPRKDLVTKHPINGKEGLYYPWTIIRGFSGRQMDKDTQHDLYFKLKEHTLQEKYIYKHKWERNDIVLSDQHHSLHRRDAYTGDRELWRAGICLR